MVAAGSNSTEAELDASAVTPVSVETVAIQSTYRYAQRLLARVETVQSTEAGFDLAGIVTDVYVEEGEQVSANDAIAKLDTERLDARRNELQSNLNRAQAELNLAMLTQKRTARLVEQNLESSQVLDEANARLDVTRAAVAQAQAQLLSLDVDLARSVLRSPFTATIVRRHVDPGVSIMPGQAILTLQSNGELELRASLPNRLASSLSVGDTVAFADGTQTATLQRFVSARNTQTRTQDALFSVDDTNWRGLNGQIVNLVVPVDKTASGMWVPMSALSSGIRGMWTVFVVSDSSSPVVESRIVEIVYTDGQRAYVSGALQDGEQLVVAGTQRLVPGQRVSMAKG